VIRHHEFNTRWWGAPVGVVHDPEFFSLDSATQQRLLEPYAWAEFYSLLDQAPPPRLLATAGFFQTDTQIQFLLNLSKVETTPSMDRLEYHFADQNNFDIEAEALATFAHERFRHIPGCTAARTNERYALWANNLIREHPETCIQIMLNHKIQGWFLSRPGEQRGLNLTLAMLSNNAEISGMLLYHQAFVAYAERGHRLGNASFSVTNTPVHNIYANMGARFLPPGGNWLWISEAAGKSIHD
jgi:hypothetical protein